MRKHLVAIPCLRYDIFEVVTDDDDVVGIALGDIPLEPGEAVEEIGRFTEDELWDRWKWYADPSGFTTKEITDA